MWITKMSGLIWHIKRIRKSLNLSINLFDSIFDHIYSFYQKLLNSDIYYRKTVYIPFLSSLKLFNSLYYESLPSFSLENTSFTAKLLSFIILYKFSSTD